MSYLDTYKRRVDRRGTTQNEIMKRHALENLERNFSHIIGCTKVIINNKRETEMVIESSADEFSKKAITRPDEDVSIGDYFEINSRFWLVKTINIDVLTPVCNLLICNQQLNARWFKKPIYCHANNTTYGSKGLIDNGSKFLELDAKTKIYIQKNEETDRLYLGYRFILNHRYVYRITEIENTIYGGIYVLTCQMDEANMMDDFENNLAYNKNEESEIEGLPIPTPEPTTTPQIIGEEQIKRGTRQTYRLEHGFAHQWTIDDEHLATVIPLSMNEVEIVTHQKSGWLTLTCECDSSTMPATTDENQPSTIQTLTKDIMIY